MPMQKLGTDKTAMKTMIMSIISDLEFTRSINWHPQYEAAVKQLVYLARKNFSHEESLKLCADIPEAPKILNSEPHDVVLYEENKED